MHVISLLYEALCPQLLKIYLLIQSKQQNWAAEKFSITFVKLAMSDKK